MGHHLTQQVLFLLLSLNNAALGLSFSLIGVVVQTSYAAHIDQENPNFLFTRSLGINRFAFCCLKLFALKRSLLKASSE